MQDFERGTARANQLTFEYLTQGEGPLALCVHGFPDSPHSYRYLLPALAEAGYRAVAPFNRGFAPTELPDDRHHIHSSTMAADQIALHEALNGDGNAVLIAHDWGAVGAWGADITQPTLYLHGTQDGCHGMTQEQVNRVPDHCGPGSQSELIDGVGHFLMVQRPTDINKRILDFLAA